MYEKSLLWSFDSQSLDFACQDLQRKHASWQLAGVTVGNCVMFLKITWVLSVLVE